MVDKYGEGYIEKACDNKKRTKAFKDILVCRTKENGFHSDSCDICGNTTIHYNSCKNPCCPKCQATERNLWVDRQKHYALNIKYFHIVFTVPEALNKYFIMSPFFMYKTLFRAVSKTLMNLSKRKKYLNAKIGVTAVLHTWGQNLSLHPHIHCIVTGGGLTKDNRWVNSSGDFFLPIKVMSSVFKGIFMKEFTEHFKGTYHDNEEFSYVKELAYAKDWVVYAKKPFNNPDSVIEYLGRYTHRIAISNARIVSQKDGKVTFKYKDYKDNNKIKEMTLDEEEFVRRFLMHVPPSSIGKIRHYGILGNRNKDERFRLLRKLTETADPGEYTRDIVKIIKSMTGVDIRVCPVCKRFKRIELPYHRKE